MKTDSQLQRDVMDELTWEPSIDHAHIGVAAKGGVVTLSGFVSNYAQKMAAEHAAERVAGVQGIAEELSDVLGGRYGALVHASPVMAVEEVWAAKKRARRAAKELAWIGGKLSACAADQDVYLLSEEGRAGGAGGPHKDPSATPRPTLRQALWTAVQQCGLFRDREYWLGRERVVSARLEGDTAFLALPLRPTQVAFATFRSSMAAKLCLAEHAQFGSIWRYRLRPVLRGKRLTVVEPPEASDIVWQNLPFSGRDRFFRQLASIAFFIALETLATVAVYFLLRFRQEHAGYAETKLRRVS